MNTIQKQSNQKRKFLKNLKQKLKFNKTIDQLRSHFFFKKSKRHLYSENLANKSKEQKEIFVKNQRRICLRRKIISLTLLTSSNKQDKDHKYKPKE